MLESQSRNATSAVADRLDQELASFCEAIELARYATTSVQSKRRSIVEFLAWLRRSRVEPSRLDESVLQSYFAAAPRRLPARWAQDALVPDALDGTIRRVRLERGGGESVNR